MTMGSSGMTDVLLLGDDEVVYHINLDIENVLFNMVKHR